MSLFNLICFLLLLNSCTAERNTLPVFIIDHDKALAHIPMEANPFEKVSTGKFVEIIQETIKHSDSVIIFVEETFSVEDITHKDKHGSPYLYMQQSVKDKKAQYLPAVIEPYNLLTHLFPPQDYNVFYLKSRKKLELIDTFKYIYIYFKDDINETRIDGLRRHDMIIKEVYSAVRQLKPGPVIVFYTGKSNPTVVEKLHFIPITPNPVPKDLGVMIVSSGALFRFTGVYSASPTRRALFNQLPMISKELWTRRSMVTKMAYTDFELEFNFSFKDYGWILGEEVSTIDKKWRCRRYAPRHRMLNHDYVYNIQVPDINIGRSPPGTITQPHRRILTLCCRNITPCSFTDIYDVALLEAGEEVGRTDMRIGAPWNMSYFCAEPLVIVNTRDGSLVTITKYKIQPRMTDYLRQNTARRQVGDDGEETGGGGGGYDETGDDTISMTKFGRSTQCAKYYSPGILSGLVVTIVCLLILAYGIMSIMEINTNDRYEDPQSKPMVHPDN